MRGIVVSVLAMAALLAPTATWAASYRITPDSQQLGPSQASAGSSVNVSTSSPGSGGNERLTRSSSTSTSSSGGGGSSSSAGIEYTTTTGETCLATPTQTPCYGVTRPTQAGPEARKAAEPVNPAALAAAVASRVYLEAGKIAASPSAHVAGLTGVASWFWLEPTPPSQTQSVALRGEHVTVSASPAPVQWAFGDGSQLTGGAGVPYRQGGTPSGAVRHVYETRCLPGDRGHDPKVLASCGPDGYQVQASVSWTITFTAAGPVTTSGTLPGRTTSATTSYPVSEARAFLTGANGR